MKEQGLSGYSVGQIIESYRQKAAGPVEVARMCIERVERLEGKYQAWVCFSPDKLLEQAGAVEARLAEGDEIRALEGVPVGVQDIFNTIDFPTGMGSSAWQGFTPGNDARVVYHVKTAGGVVPGKTVTSEFGAHAPAKTLNPHDITRTSGAATCGSAVAVALGMVPVSLGVQAADAIIRSASYCGVYGCKPSFGLIPRTGMLKCADSLDTIGYFAGRLEDLERVFDAVRVHGLDYPVSNAALNDPARQNKPHSRPWRVALTRNHVWKYAYPYAREAFEGWAKKLSGVSDIEVTEIDPPPDMELAQDVHRTIYDRAITHYYRKELTETYSPVLKEILKRGEAIPVPDYHRALRTQESLARCMDDLLQSYDVMISLSTAGEAPLLGENEVPDPAALMWTLTHLPVISAPVFTSPGGLPFGAQLAARRYNDHLLFKFAACLCSEGMLPEGVNPETTV